MELTTIKSWANSYSYTAASKHTSPEMHRLIDLFFHYVSYIVVELRVYGVSVADTTAGSCKSTTRLG